MTEETNDQFAERRGYKTTSLCFPTRAYDSLVTVLSWSPAGQAYDVHKFPEGFDPNNRAR